MMHLDPWPGQPLARAVNDNARVLCDSYGIKVEIQWVSGHSGIPKNGKADRQANKAQSDLEYTVRELIYTSAANRARRISEGQSTMKAQWESDKCGKHFSYRLKGKAGSKRPIPMTSVKSLATRSYRLKSGHAPTGVYLKCFGHWEDKKCWWCGGTTAQTWEHLFRHCSRWKEEQQELWREFGKAMGWKVSRCRNIQISELFTIETCDQAVMDFLAATDIGKFPTQVS